MSVVQIDIGMDEVIIEGQQVRRPERIGRMAWLSYWERIAGNAASDLYRMDYGNVHRRAYGLPKVVRK